MRHTSRFVRDAAGKKLRDRYDLEYYFDEAHPRTRQVVSHARKTIFINAAADWNADQVVYDDRFDPIRPNNYA